MCEYWIPCTLQGFRTFAHIFNYRVEHMNQIISPTKFHLNERMKSEGNSNENAFENEQLYQSTNAWLIKCVGVSFQ